MIIRKKYLAGGLIRGAISYATKKFLKEGSKKFPSKSIKKGLTKNQRTQADTYRKAKIVEYAHNKLNKLGENITSVVTPKGRVFRQQKNKKHFDRVNKTLDKITKDQKKLRTMGDVLKNKNLKAQGRKPNFKGGLIRKPKLAKRGF